MTSTGRAHCMRRLSAATTLDDLRAVWERLGVDPQHDAQIIAHKDKLKAGFM